MIKIINKLIISKRMNLVFLSILFMILEFVSPIYADVKEDNTNNNTNTNTNIEESIYPESKIVRVACGMNDSLYLDEAGNPQGICLAYLRQLAWNNGWTLEYVEGSYSECIQNLYDGKVDMMFPVGMDDDVSDSLAFAKFIGGYQQIGLFANKDAEIYYDDYEGFNNCKVGLSIGANSIILDAYASQHNFNYEKKPLNSIKDKTDALANGDVDLIAFSTLNSVPGGKLVAVLDQVPFYFCTLKDNKELLDEINKGMSECMVNTPDLVADMYYSVLKGNTPISLTREENDKIKKTDKVTFGVYGDRLPLAGINSDGECVGIYVDLLKEIAAVTGLNIEIKPIKDDNRLYSYIDDGTVDFVIGIRELRFSSENADNHLASNGMVDCTTVAVTMPDYKFEDDNMPIIALTKDRTYLEEFIQKKYPDSLIKYFSSRKSCLDAIQNGKADATFLNTWEFNYESKNARYQDLIEWENIRISSVVVLGGTKQSDTELLSILEKTISLINNDKKSEIVSSNLNMTYESYNLKDRIYEFRYEILIIGSILIVIFIFIVIYIHIKKKYIRNLEKANRTKSDFLSRMSHELRTPLNAINGYSTLTIRDAEQGKTDSDLLMHNMKSIQKASEYLLGIIKDILDVQQMETGEYTLEKSMISLMEYMNNIVNIIKPLANEKHINFSYKMSSGKGYDFYLDELRMQQVLFKVLFNAIKFTSEGGNVKLTSEVRIIDDKDAKIIFVITDDGIGMSKEFMRTRLFEKFAQENHDITSPYTGCGNGLAICKELINLMGGEINCESEQGKGTTFIITIITGYMKKTEKVRVHRPVPNYDLSGIRVLMCEDNVMNQDMEKRVLERMKCLVEIAEDGKAGLEKFEQSSVGYYDIILMDIRMPNMDGLQATRKIRAIDREDSKKVPILAVSANAFEEDIKKSLDAGMNEHLAKPVSARELYEKIKQYCQK